MWECNPSLPRSGGALEAAALSGCWRVTGVYGEGSCAELGHYAHCRNCPVFAQAGLEAIDRPASASALEEATLRLGVSRPAAEPAQASAVLFRLGFEWFALPTGALHEIVEGRTIHSLPHRAGSVVLGLANVHGELVVCVSLQRLLGRSVPPERSIGWRHGRLILLNWERRRLAFPVEEVGGPWRYGVAEVAARPGLDADPGGGFTRGVLRVNDCPAVMLEPDLLLAALNRMLA